MAIRDPDYNPATESDYECLDCGHTATDTSNADCPECGGTLRNKSLPME